MYIKFIKDHKSGISKGDVKKVYEDFGLRMIEEGFAKESNEKEFNSFVKDTAFSSKNHAEHVAKVNEAKEKERKARAELEAKLKEESEAKKDSCEDCGGDQDCEDCKKKI